MKTIIKNIMAIALLLSCYMQSRAQAVSNTSKLELSKVAAYQMEITYNKTSHLIFPAAIRYVDLGSEYLVAGKAEDAENVLRIKASVRDFQEETNFSVITEDGRFYNFNVSYSPLPATMNYDLLTMQKSLTRDSGNGALFSELGNNSPSLTGLIMETIYKKDKRRIRHIGAKAYGIEFLLKGIYIHNDKFYFHTEIRNRSNVPFQIDFVHFKVVDKKRGRRTAIQERPLLPLRMYKPLENVEGNTVDANVFLLDQITIADDKVLLIEMYEKNDGRHQVLKVHNSNLIKARHIKDMHLKIY